MHLWCIIITNWRSFLVPCSPVAAIWSKARHAPVPPPPSTQDGKLQVANFKLQIVSPLPASCQVKMQIASYKLKASCHACSELPGQVVVLFGGKLPAQARKLPVQVSKLPAQIGKLPAIGGTWDQKLSS